MVLALPDTPGQGVETIRNRQAWLDQAPGSRREL